MPTAGTHITLLEQLLLKHPDLQKWLGNPDPTSGGELIEYAKLGAVGPDLFYMLGDYSIGDAVTPLQDMLSLMVKIAGSFSCFSQLSEQANKLVTQKIDDAFLGIASELSETGKLLKSVVTDGLLALLVDNGVNLWGFFGASARQWGSPVSGWYWADYLHYYRTGDFTRYLLDAARQSGDPRLLAYALGYLTHYVTDVVGHPFVNQITQSPYRLHHQRHHMIENFIDAYLWDRYHVPTPPANPRSPEEAPLDSPTGPNNMTCGAPLTMARLNDQIDIGDSTLDKRLDEIVHQAVRELEEAANRIGTWIGVAEKIEIEPPKDNAAWCKFMAVTMKNYCADMEKLAASQTPAGTFERPTILARGPDPRPNGVPNADDVGEAYGILRLMLKLQSEEDIERPVFPDIAGDVTGIIQDTIDKIVKDIGGTPPVPMPNTSGSFSLKELVQYLANLVVWTAEVAEHLADAVKDFVGGVTSLATAAVVEPFRVLIWMLNSGLYELYRYLRDILVVNAYCVPFSDELCGWIGPLKPQDLWVAKGNPPAPSPSLYPVAEYFNDDYHSDRGDMGHLHNDYHPTDVPSQAQPGQFEMPFASPAPFNAGDRPEVFLEKPVGPNDLFQPAANASSPDRGFKDVGGAIENCFVAITTYMTAPPGRDLSLPNYDLDGDRGYAWLNWKPNECAWTVLDPAQNTQKPLTINNPLVIE